MPSATVTSSSGPTCPVAGSPPPTAGWAWAYRYDSGAKYFEFTDKTKEILVVGEKTLSNFGDGHCTYSDDGACILTDTYPDEKCHRKIILYQRKSDRVFILGEFYSQKWIDEGRCDLHPRFDRTCSRICFDSSHTGKRQMFVIEIGKL